METFKVIYEYVQWKDGANILRTNCLLFEIHEEASMDITVEDIYEAARTRVDNYEDDTRSYTIKDIARI